MGVICKGYGSEWHLLRYLGYHRHYLTNYIKTKIPIFHKCNLLWRDFKFSNTNEELKRDKEYKGIEIFTSKALSDSWSKYWPQTGNCHNWDAIGEIFDKSSNEFVFVEAKAHLKELESDCGAGEKSKKQIKEAFYETIDYFEIEKGLVKNWLKKYYQFSNRLAFLAFLLKNDIKAHLIFIYFYGETHKGWHCPSNKSEWNKNLEPMYNHLGIDSSKIDDIFYNRVHKIYLPTNPKAD